LKLITSTLAALILSGCTLGELFGKAEKVCEEALGAVELICTYEPITPVGAGGGQLTDPANPDCVVISADDHVPLEYCRD